CQQHSSWPQLTF
nr:immunoglobulin light chain junction region [Macaca mulatta]MPN90870.1 immunoglobulin light chain junction region [Macaca mulatta]MPN90880.1 immunoglobulin light chain junction region [Macaca mulatta]MPN91110.1 immunoglobulin light chain junction region [Macaca mulatta]MPN91119.1 immunoglobulin light chain junction region [Macaca mulatta]